MDETYVVREARDGARLVLERTLHLLVNHIGLGEVEDLDVAIARTHHQERVTHAQRQALVRQRLRVRWRLLPQVPVPQRLVPAPCVRGDRVSGLLQAQPLPQ